MAQPSFNRRSLLLGASALGLSGCKVLDGANTKDSALRGAMEAVGKLSYRTQRLLGGGHTLAPEYAQADIRQGQRPNGSTDPADATYRAMAATGFADYRLQVTGLVDAPQSLPLGALKAMPARSQITRHDCVEGWSCIAKWTGVPLGLVLDLARPRVNARFALFHCYDALGGGLSGPLPYYESIDLIDAWHPQTILAWNVNDAPLPVANGAPLRVRVERQLGYKMAKYVHTIELVESFAGFGRGHGSYWADQGYEWYAGI